MRKYEVNFLKIICPHCNASLNAPEHLIGKQGRCPKCAKIITVSSEEIERNILSSEKTTIDPVGKPETNNMDREWPGNESEETDEYLTEQVEEKKVLKKQPPDIKSRKCPKCGNAISAGASACPKCSKTGEDRFPIHPAFIALILLVVGVAVFSYSYFQDASPKKNIERVLNPTGVNNKAVDADYMPSHWNKLSQNMEKAFRTMKKGFGIPKRVDNGEYDAIEEYDVIRAELLKIQDDIRNIEVSNMADVDSFSNASYRVEIGLEMMMEAFLSAKKCQNNTIDAYQKQFECEMAAQGVREAKKNFEDAITLIRNQ